MQEIIEEIEEHILLVTRNIVKAGIVMMVICKEMQGNKDAEHCCHKNFR